MSNNTIEFIKKAKEVHSDKYDYSKVEYEHNLKEVIIICKEHGVFLQLPKTHKRGSGCIKCGRDKLINSKKGNTDDFINKAMEIHGNKYVYSKVEYKKAGEKVIIICKEHGAFEQTPNGHLSKKNGCKKCSTEINSFKQRKTKEQFIEESIQIHSDKYDYSKVEYKKAGEKVIIICKEHGAFEQTPNSHLSKKSGCIKCAGCYKSNTEEFVKKATEIHGNNYDYSKVEYKKAIEKIIIICKKHGEFEQTPNGHLDGRGCNKCGYHMFIFSNNDFINKANEIHNDKYNYCKVNYIKMNEKVIITCKEHGDFKQTPSNHITHKQGCQICANNYLSNTAEFIEKSIIINGNKYDYSKVNYINNHTKVLIICKEHGNFEQQPDSHLRGCGCPYCINKTEFILYEYIQLLNYIITKQFKKDWCKNNNTNKYLPFDFCIEECKIIIELDGRQHFEQVMNWKTPEEQLDNDKYKQKCANENGYSIIRLLQEDVFNDKYDWKTELVNNIEKIKTDNIIQNIYMCKNNEYENFIN
jgi:very-short-patch-repair endonuclease